MYLMEFPEMKEKRKTDLTRMRGGETIIVPWKHMISVKYIAVMTMMINIMRQQEERIHEQGNNLMDYEGEIITMCIRRWDRGKDEGKNMGEQIEKRKTQIPSRGEKRRGKEEKKDRNPVKRTM